MKAARRPAPATRGAGPATPLAAAVGERLAARGWLRHDAPLGVALSGGLDSQVLLHLLRFAIVPAGGLFAIHYDHRMRAGSAADCAWVVGLCRAWQVPLVAACSAHALRSETEARHARYAFFESAIEARPGARVVTAHHADDQAETIVYRLLRGTGLHGLRGIPAERGPYIRPLLDFGREELEAYARANGIRARIDETNADLTRPRNAIRHLLLPHLERTRPGARTAILRLVVAAAAADDAFGSVLDDAERLAARQGDDGAILLASAVIRAYHPQVRALLLRRLLARLGSAPGRAGTSAAMQFITTGRSGGRIDLPGGIRLERNFDEIVLRPAARAPSADASVVILAPGSGRAVARIGGRRVRVRWSDAAPVAGKPATRVDARAVRFPLVVRGWQPGDRIRLAYGTKKLKKLFGELRLDRQARSRTPVLAEGRGRVLWVVGHTRSVDARAEHGPALHITVMDG